MLFRFSATPVSSMIGSFWEPDDRLPPNPENPAELILDGLKPAGGMLRLFALALEGDIGGGEAPFPFICGLLIPVAIGAMVAIDDEDGDDG